MHHTERDVRDELDIRLKTMTQADVARVTGIHTPNISNTVRGGPIPAKLLAWLGFKQVTGIYERLP